MKENGSSVFSVIFKEFIAEHFVHGFEFVRSVMLTLKQLFIFGLRPGKKKEYVTADEISNSKKVFTLLLVLLVIRTLYHETHGAKSTHIEEETLTFLMLVFYYAGLNFFILSGRLTTYLNRTGSAQKNDGIFILEFNFLFITSSVYLLLTHDEGNFRDGTNAISAILIHVIYFLFGYYYKDTFSRNKFISVVLFIILTALFYFFYVFGYLAILEYKPH